MKKNKKCGQPFGNISRIPSFASLVVKRIDLKCNDVKVFTMA